uniref:Dachshund homolog 2-like n=1 Tax=Cyprinus carpio TaxID=7962 RepID=A0A8C2H2Y2_CYPCA
MITMAVPATLPVHSGTSAVSANLFRTDPFFSSPADSPRLSNSLNATLPSGAATNECNIVEVHGVKVASFNVDGYELICLPQVFDLFLKHLVGGLHTVYTKLKRLDINPVVCTVEQVRVLRGLGAIQPGVNRCKLISRKDFEALYNDCTSASYCEVKGMKSLSLHGHKGLLAKLFVFEFIVTRINATDKHELLLE